MRPRAALRLALVMLAGCSAVPPKAGPLPPGLAGTSWRAASITGLPPLPGVTSTLTFVGPDRVAGDAGCNRYGGALAVEDDRLRIGPLVATRMACAPLPMEQERRFMTALEQGVAFERDGADLLLRSAGRGEPTRFVPARP